jgi:hypothetical protein
LLPCKDTRVSTSEAALVKMLIPVPHDAALAEQAREYLVYPNATRKTLLRAAGLPFEAGSGMSAEGSIAVSTIIVLAGKTADRGNPSIFLGFNNKILRCRVFGCERTEELHRLGRSAADKSADGSGKVSSQLAPGEITPVPQNCQYCCNKDRNEDLLDTRK